MNVNRYGIDPQDTKAFAFGLIETDDYDRFASWTPVHTGHARSNARGNAIGLFAKANSWKARPPFSFDVLLKAENRWSLPDLISKLNDSVFFVDKDSVPVAIAAGYCNSFEDTPEHDCESYMHHVRTLGLEARLPPAKFASFYNPGSCRLVVVTRRGENVRWLPEQADLGGPYAVPADRRPRFKSYLRTLTPAKTAEGDLIRFLQAEDYLPPLDFHWQLIELLREDLPSVPVQVVWNVWKGFEAWRRFYTVNNEFG